MTTGEMQQGTRVRLARIPRYLPADDPRWNETLGKTGTVLEVSRLGTVFVQWDDGTQGSWLPQYLDPPQGK